MTVLVDLPAVRPARLADALVAEDLTEHVREFRRYLRNARTEPLADGVRLVVTLDLRAIAAFADLVRSEADTLPCFHFRVLVDPPECWLEVTGQGRAGDVARAAFGEMGA